MIGGELFVVPDTDPPCRWSELPANQHLPADIKQLIDTPTFQQRVRRGIDNLARSRGEKS